MKTMIVCVSMFALFSLAGCSHNVAPAAAPSNQATNLSVEPSSVMEVRCVSNPDGFSKTGEVVGDVGRWSYNSLTHGFEWLVSDQNKERAEKVYSGAKDMTVKAYDAAIDAYHKHSDK